MRSRSRDRRRSRSVILDKRREMGRDRSRGSERVHSRSPFRDLGRSSNGLTEKISGSGMTSTKLCRDFAEGKCRRGNQCRFFHQDNLAHNDVADRWRSRANRGSASKYLDNKGSENSLQDKISDGYGKYCEEYESLQDSRKYTSYCKGKCHRGASCRYPHKNSSGDNLDDNNNSWNGPKWNEDASFSDKAKTTIWEEDKKKSWNGPTWDDVAGFSDEPKAIRWGDSNMNTTKSHDPTAAFVDTDEKWAQSLENESKTVKVADGDDFFSTSPYTGKVTGWGKDKKISWNDPKWDVLAALADRPKPIGWGDNHVKNKNALELVAANKLTDDNWGHSLEKERKSRGGPASKNLEGRSKDDRWGHILDDKFILRNYPRDAPAGGFLDTAKITGQAEDKKKSWNDVAGSLERPKAAGWADSSIGNMNSCDPTAADMQADDKWACSLENKIKARVTSGRSEKAAERDKYLNSHQKNGNGSSRDDRWGYNRDGKKKSRNGPRDADAGFLDTAKSMGQGRDTKNSRNGPRDADAGFLDSTKSMGQRRDMKKSQNGPKWDDVAGSLKSPKATGWEDKKKSWNGPTWDDVGGSSKSAMATGWEDEKKSWNGPTWEDVAGSKVTGWADSSTRNLNSHDPTVADMQADDRRANCLENERKSRVASGSNEKAVKRDNYLTSHRQNSNVRSCDERWSYKVDGNDKSRNGPRDATAGFLDTAKSTGFGEDKKKSWNGPTWDDVAGSLENPKATGWEDKKKSWNGPTWHGVAGSSESPNATGWEDKKKSWNGPTWDDVAGSLESPKATGWAYSSIGSMNSLDPTIANMQTDDGWARISENERKARVASGWNEKAAEREKFLTSHQQNDNGRSCDDRWCYNMDDKKNSRNCQWHTAAGFLDTSKSMGHVEDKKKSWSGPTWDDVAGPLECVKATGWEDKKKSWNGPTWDYVVGSLERPNVTGWADNSIISMNSLDPTAADMQTDDIWACSLENERKARDAKVNKWEKKVVANPEVSGRNEIVAGVNSNTDELGKKYRQQQNKNHLGSIYAHGEVEESNGIQDEKVLLLLKSALVEFITEILKPACKEGQMGKEDHNIIVRKVVDKVTSSIRGVYVPKTAVHVDEYMSFSKLKIFNLVNEYVKIFRKRELIA